MIECESRSRKPGPGPEPLHLGAAGLYFAKTKCISDVGTRRLEKGTGEDKGFAVWLAAVIEPKCQPREKAFSSTHVGSPSSRSEWVSLRFLSPPTGSWGRWGILLGKQDHLPVPSLHLH